MKKIILSVAFSFFVASTHAQIYIQSNSGFITGKILSAQSSSGYGLGYKINPNVSVDAFLQELYHKSNAGNTSTYKTTELFVRAIGSYPIVHRFFINAKVGISETKIASGFAGAKGSTTFGVGLDFAFTEHFNIGLDIDSYHTKGSNLWQASKLRNTALVVKYNF